VARLEPTRSNASSSSPSRLNIASGSPFEEVFGYCRAVRVGNTVHVAGTCAAQDQLDGTDTYTQAVSALAIIQTALAEAGTGPESVVRTITYVTNIDDMEQVAKAHFEVFGSVRPAATLVEVSRLIDPRMTIEIEAYAVIADD
jgi:enamine deaminase RidA (YjgF/YER057c/UK114 family)